VHTIPASFVWKNGKIVPWQQATVHVSCHGLHYGTGVFEGIRCYNTPSGPALFRLGSHIDRWFLSAQTYGLCLPYSRQDLMRATLELVRANGFSNCYIRPIAFWGSQTLALNPKGCPIEIVILAWPWANYMGPDALVTGIDVCLSPWKRISPHAIPTKAKACGQYLNSVLAIQDASRRGFAEAILLDEAGHVTEATGENLFLVDRNRLVTNDQESAVLLGVTRDTVLQLANDLNLAVFIQKIRPEHLFHADEAFLTGTASEITPVASIDMHPIGGGRRGQVTAKLAEAYQQTVTGRNPRHLDWLTYVMPH